jgi:hypothetical protein
MIESITVYQKLDKSDAFTMVLNDPHNVTDHSGFVIENIDGLGPVDADINMTEMAIDGDHFNSARIGKRNIVFDLVYYGEYGNDIQGVRRRSYSLFPTKKRVFIEVATDDRTVWTVGNVEKNEPDIFSKDCKSQVSILCGDPKWYDSDGAKTTTFTQVETTDPPFYYGEINYEYDSVAVGGILTITFGSDITGSNDPILRVSCENATFDIYAPKNGFKNGDTLAISSIPGNKYCIWTDETEAEINALHLLSKDPDWITVEPGGCNIMVTGSTNAIKSVVFENPICYEGV